MEALKIPLRQRSILVLDRCGQYRKGSAPWFLLQRWAGQLPDDTVTQLPDGRVRMSSGFCGHTSFWKRRILRHRHPEAGE